MAGVVRSDDDREAGIHLQDADGLQRPGGFAQVGQSGQLVGLRERSGRHLESVQCDAAAR